MEGYIMKITILLMCLQIDTVFGVYSPEKETEIRSETVLHANYDYISRPLATTEVNIGISILAIDELDLKSQKLSAAGWITLEWEDDRLTWTPSAKDDIEVIFSEPAKIWKPEIVIDNSLDDLGVISDSSLYLRIESDGKVDWEPSRLFTTHCQVDITYYPYDRQKCSINIVGWGYTIDEVKLKFLATPINIEDFETHGEWEIYNSETVSSEITETSGGVTKTFPVLEYWIYISRRTMFYDLNVIMPIILTSLLVALTFVVPVESGEKLSYILTVFLALAVLLTITSDSLPPTSISTSVLGLYLGIVTVMSALSILLTVLLLMMYHRTGSPKPNSCFYTFTQCAARFTCMATPEMFKRSRVRQVTPATVNGSAKTPTQEAEVDDVVFDVTWQEMAIILDRFCFIIFLVMTVVMNMSFMIALASGGKNSDP